MKIFFKKLLLKVTDKQKHSDYKNFLRNEKNKKLFKDIYEEILNNIQKKNRITKRTFISTFWTFG